MVRLARKTRRQGSIGLFLAAFTGMTIPSLIISAPTYAYPATQPTECQG